jgi:hypothetical protein
LVDLQGREREIERKEEDLVNLAKFHLNFEKCKVWSKGGGESFSSVFK